MNLIYHESNYDLRGQILRHLNTANLSQIVNQYFTSKPIENENYYIAENFQEKKSKDSLNKQGLLPYNKNLYFQKNRKHSDFMNFHKKNFNLNYSKTTRDSLEYRTILNYSHMKTILGHVQMDESLSISPVSIFCMCFSEDSEFIYTGDDIGTIKIWSTLTGGIIETFRLFSANEEKSAITDLLAFNNCLIACSEDKTVVIWNTKTLQICGSFSFDEGLLNVNGYKYVYEGITRNLLIVGAQSGKMYFIDMDINDSTNEEYKNIFPIKFHIDKTIQDNYNLGKTKSLELSGMSSDDFNGLLVSGFHDGLVCIWDTNRILNAAIQKREFLYNFTQYVFYAQLCHRTTVQLVEFSPDKTHFLTGSLDGTVLVWKIFPELIASIRKDYYLKKEINIFRIYKKY
jgi:WD40 repeat protein